MSARAKIVGGTLLVTSLLLGACSDDDTGGDDDSTEPADISELIAASGTGTLSGAVEGEGDFTLQYPEPYRACDELAEADTYIVPLPTTVSDAQVVWQAAVPALDGPGTYSLDDLAGLRATVSVAGGEPRVFGQVDATTAELTLEDDGSGEFSFSGLQDASGAQLGGGSSWTCGPREIATGG